MDPITLILLIAMPLLLVASGVFSGSETALFSLKPHEQVQLARSTSAPGQAVTQLLRETTPLLVTLLISNMVVNVLYFTLSTLLLGRLSADGTIGPAGAGGLAVATLLGVILFGEVLPKQVAAQRAQAWALLAALPLLALHRALTALRVVILFALITPLSRLIAPPTPPAELSAEELGAMLKLSQHGGVIDANEQDLLVRVIELGRLKVRDLMVPRVDVRAHAIDAPPAELVALARETRLRYLPVYRDTPDTIIGIVLSREVLVHPPKTPAQVEALVKPVRFVPEIATADVLLAKLREEATVFAVAVDEYGGTAGVITLEDLVEHVVGDIPGAYERGDEPLVESVGPGEFRVDADLPVHEWAQWFGRSAELSRAAADATSVGGLVLSKLGRFPAVGDRVTLGNILFTVEAMDGRRIDTLTIALSEPEAQAQAQADAADETPADADTGGTP